MGPFRRAVARGQPRAALIFAAALFFAGAALLAPSGNTRLAMASVAAVLGFAAF